MDKLNISYVASTGSELKDLRYLNFFARIIKDQVIETQLALRWNMYEERATHTYA